MPTLFRPLSPGTPSSDLRPVVSVRQRALLKLQRQALGHAGWHLLGLGLVFCGLAGICPREALLRWPLQTMPVLAVVHIQLWRFLDQNRRPGDGRLLANLGVANAITLARGWGIALLAGWAGWSQPWTGRPAWMVWTPGLLYLAIGAADFVDGFWARRTATESLLGRRLDMEMDALGLLVAMLLAVDLGRLPFFYLAGGALYYLFRLGLWGRRHAGRITMPLRERPFARFTAGIQMGFVGIALVPWFAPDALHLAAACFLLPLGLGFIWDWMVVCGRLGLDTDRRWRQALRRAGDMAAAGVRLILLGSGPVVAGDFLPALPLAAGTLLTALWVSMVLGWMGRGAALGAMCLLACNIPETQAAPLFMTALQIFLVLFIIGTGRWSWWRPEDAFFFAKPGASARGDGCLAPGVPDRRRRHPDVF